MKTIAMHFDYKRLGTWLAGAGVFAAALIIAGAAVLANSTTTEVDSSRQTEYHSLEQLEADSSLAVEGRVLSQREGAIPGYGDVPPIRTTISEFEVARGADLQAKGEAPTSGKTILVTQIGTADQSFDGPLLQADGKYMLFLTADPDGTYFITGVTAGMFEADEEGTYRHSFPGIDKLPELIDPDQFL